MYYDFPVKIPAVKGKIITKKKGDAAYILFEYGREYKPDKQYAIPKRAIIGKVSPLDSTQMYPNERYQEYFPEVELPEVLPDAYRSCCLRIGAYAIIQKVLDEYQLPKILKAIIPNDYGLFLDLVSYLIVDEDNAGQYYPDFAFCHPLFSEDMHIYSDSKVSRLLNSLTREHSIAFLEAWNKNRDQKQRIYLSYDSTNKNCQAGDIDIVEFGKAKDSKGLPIFNLSIAFDKTNRIPLFYEEYPGSITDVSQFSYMVDKVIDYGYKNVGFILDRGYFSKDNIKYMDDNHYEFVIMVKGCKTLVSDLVEANRGTFEDKRSSSIRAYKVYGTTVTSFLYEDDTKERFFHIYYNPSKQAAEREILEQKLDKYKQFINKHIGKEVSFANVYNDYFTFEYDASGRLIFYSEREDVIEKELKLCGYFCIITSEDMDATQALIHYKGRDISEKLFQADKSFIGSKSMRTQSAEAMSSKIFVEFVALIVRNRIYNLLKEELIKIEANPNYMTVPAAIRELEKIEMVRRSNGIYKLDHAVTKKQKVILSSFGMDETNITQIAARISNLLKASRSLIADDEEDDYGTQ